MSRRSVPALASPHPLGELLPGLYLDDDLVQRWTAGLDEVLAPVFLTLDSLDAYFDARIAPVDFLGWLAGWVDADLDERWPESRSREVIGAATTAHAHSGTARALIEHVRRCCGVEVRVEESGGTVCSRDPDTAPPGTADPHLTVILPVADLDAIGHAQLVRAIDQVRPAHLAVRVRAG